MRRLALTGTAFIVIGILTVSAAAQPPAERREPATAQRIEVAPPDVLQELTLRDGTRAVGRVERVEGSRVLFRTAAGSLLETDVAQVLAVRVVEGVQRGGTFYRADPNPTRLFFGPTARSVRAGTGYVGVYEVFFPFVQVGITDRISMGAGTPLFFGSDSEHPFWLTPKVQIYSGRRTQAAVGVMHFMNVGDGHLGIAYGTVTHGSSDSAVTVGTGYAYVRSSGEIDGAGLVMLGGEHRVSQRVKLISENYLFEGFGLASMGIRFVGERLSADLGLVVPLGAEERVVFPMVNFVWQFGRGRQ